MGDSITEGTIVEWTKKPGEYIAKDDVLVVIETDKVSVDVRATVSGIVQEHKAAPSETVAVGAPLVVIKEQAGGPAAVAKPAATPAAAPAATPAAPAVEAPKKVEVKQEAKPATKAAPVKAAEPASAPKSAGDRSESRVKMTRMRNRISERLKESQNTAAMLTTFQEVDMTELIALRNR